VRLNDAAAPKDPTSLPARQKSLLAASMMLSGPGIPMLLQGAEFLQEGAFNDWQALDWENLERYQGVVTARRHLIDLRLNRFGHTAGLLGSNTAIIHQDDSNFVIAYHRWDQGGPGDDVIIIANFSSNQYADYFMRLPHTGTWNVRFNSSWKGYSADFREVQFTRVTTDADHNASLTIAPYSVYILSQD
jgi:1,4-alpha-glucan branching enzyme